MSDLKTTLERTNQQLTFFLEELAQGRSFDMSDFQEVAAGIEQGVAELGIEKSLAFRGDIEALLAKLDLLQKGLVEKRTVVKKEIESLNRQLSANLAYRKTDTQQ